MLPYKPFEAYSSPDNLYMFVENIGTPPYSVPYTGFGILSNKKYPFGEMNAHHGSHATSVRACYPE